MQNGSSIFIAMLRIRRMAPPQKDNQILARSQAQYSDLVLLLNFIDHESCNKTEFPQMASALWI